MLDLRGARIIGSFTRARALQGASPLALFVAGLSVAAPAAAQVGPGSAQCPITAMTVTCTGDVSPGVVIAPPDSYEQLILRDLTVPVRGSNAEGASIDFVNTNRPVTITIDDPNVVIIPRGAARDDGNGFFTRYIAIRARANANISIESRARITIDAAQAVPVQDNGGVRGIDVAYGAAASNVAVTNNGTIDITGFDNLGARGIYVERLDGASAATVSILNAGQINIRNFTTSGDGMAAAIAPLDTLTIRNTGQITFDLVQDDEATLPSFRGISVSKELQAGLNNTRTTIVNDGTIQTIGTVTELTTTEGIRAGVFFPVLTELPTRQETGLIDVVNNGTISVVHRGIHVLASSPKSVTNTGTIAVTGRNGTGVEMGYTFSFFLSEDPRVRGRLVNPIGLQSSFVNAGSGTISVINASTTAQLIGVGMQAGSPTIVNDGTITVRSGNRATGIRAGNFLDERRVTGQVGITNSGTIEATGIAATGILIERVHLTAADVFNTQLSSSGRISGLGVDSDALRFVNVAASDAPAALADRGQTNLTFGATSVVTGGSGTGAGIRFIAGERHSVVNAGLITAPSGNAVIGGTAAEAIDNSGRIEGAVTLAGGADRVIARDGGLITGAVAGGDGTDVLQLDVATGTAALTDRIGGAVSGFELLEKTGTGTLTLAQPVAPRAALLGGTLATSGDLAAMAVDAGAGTTLAATGRLGAVTLAGGATLSPGGGAVGTVELASLAMLGSSRLRFDFSAPGQVGGTHNDLINVTGNLILDGLLDINPRPNFGNGVYRLINYAGTLTDNGLAMGAAPSATYTVQTGVAGQVNLVVGGFSGVQFWDGGDTAADSTVDGGSGTWNNTTTNWTTPNGDFNSSWLGGFAVFQGTPGTVTIDAGGVSAQGLQFAVNGYRIEGGALTLLAPATLRVGDGSAGGAGYTATIASVIQGSGGIDKTDLGTLVLGGANTYTGGTRIGGGVVEVAADSNLGAAAGAVTLDGGTLRFSAADTSARGFTIDDGGGTIDAANALTLSGAIGGSGGLVKTGPGTLTLSGNSSAYAGTTSINGGVLNLTGSLGGMLTVQNGGRLLGTGTLGGLTVASGGTVAPGGSVGNLNISGDAIFRAGSIYELEIASAAGSGDRITVGGAATIEGGTIRVVALDPESQYVAGTRYTFLTAAAGRTGMFTGLTETSAFLDFTLGYDANSAFLTVDVVRTFPTVAQTFNQTQSSTALAAFGQTAGSDSLAVYNQLLLADAAGARAAFDAASGEIYPVLLASGLRQGAGRAERLLGRSYELGGEGWGLWGSANGYDGRIDGDGNGARFEHNGIGGELGVDYRGASNGWAIGVGGGHDKRDIDLPARGSAAEADGWHIGGYARYGSGGAGFSATVSGAYASGEADVARAITVGTVTRAATARLDVDSWSVGGEARYGLVAGGGWALGPQVQITHSRADLGRFTEVGATSLNLSGGADNDDDRTRYGGGLFARWDGPNGSIDASLAYLRGGEDPTEIGLSMAGAATPYRVRAAAGDGDTVQLNLAGRLELGGGWAIGANAGAAIGSNERFLQGSATIGLKF